MRRSSLRSPTIGLLAGLVITVAAIAAYSAYISHQISGLQSLQNNLIERNRKASLQLLRVQNDLNSLGLAMRDMLDGDEPYPLTAWTAQFARVHEDLDDALQIEAQLGGNAGTTDQKQYLATSLAQFWDAADRTFALARDGKDKEAREQIRLSMQARQQALSTAVSRLLVQNNESDEQAARQVRDIYDRVQRQVYLFLTATMAAIVFTSLYVIRSNRRLFAQLAELSQQRSDLAQKLISTQESTLRHISRELHDEFGQILTAVGSMLGRVERHTPEESPLRAELREVRDIAQTTLQNIRSLSQALHPVMLDEAGLESTIDWYIPMVEKQTGIDIHYDKSGTSYPVDGGAAIHIYRVLQEALNNVARHSGAREAWVRLRFTQDFLELEVEDRGAGMNTSASKPGMGTVAMRERAGLLTGTIELLSRLPQGGTLVRLKVPRSRLDSHGQ